ncbi:alcohol dehydrogenase [Gammaproteobacteria bacterium 45_16_T64]|nr:alcohol dehydrogenase [Gammaproteobacteria bacterium 45_16_T64]
MDTKWENILIHSDQTIREALELINAESLRVVLVVDENRSLLGTVTDGDIRRGLLNNLQLSAPVSDVMKISPITTSSSTPKSELVELMKREDILSIPVLENGIVVGLETLQSALSCPKYENPIFLMAGGFGTRLKPLTDFCPKPMLVIGDRPMLETVLESFIKAGFVNFYVSTHYMADQVRDHFGDGSQWNVNISYVHEEAPLGTGGALGLLPVDMPDLPIIMMNGDILTNVDFQRLLEFHNENDADATMCVREYEYQVPYGVITGEGNKIKSMIEKPIQRYFVNAGIYVVSQRLARSVPSNHKVDMPTILEKSLDVNDSVLMFPIHEYWLDIGRMDDFNRAQVDIRTLGLAT